MTTPVFLLLKFVMFTLFLIIPSGVQAVDAQLNHEKLAGELPAKRIIALAPHIVENLYAIGAGELIIGTTDHADYPTQAKNIPVIGNYAQLSIEKILALDPDLIIAWKTGNPPADIEKLQKYGIKVVYSQPVKLEDVAKELIYFGELTGKTNQAKQVANTYLAELSQIKKRYQTKKPVTVFYELWPQPLTTIANNAWPQQQINLCRVDNPFINAETDYPQVNLEQVVVKNPDIIIQPRSAKEYSTGINWQQWKNISAVKFNRFISPDVDKTHRMTIRVLEELSLLCKQIDVYRGAINAQE